jgi:hypothetical protein
MSGVQNNKKGGTSCEIKSNVLTSLGNEDAMDDSKSENSTAALLNGYKEETVVDKAKALWKNLKEDNEERKQNNIQHVTTNEATAITGHGENAPESDAKKGKGDKRMAGTVLFC